MASTDEKISIVDLPVKVIDQTDYLPIVTPSGATRKGLVSDIVAEVRIEVEQGGAIAEALTAMDAKIAQVDQLISEGYQVKDNWNVGTNTPDLSTIGPANGDAYVVYGGGTTSLTGVSIAAVDGDVFHYTDGAWVYIPKALVPVDGSVTRKKTDMFSRGKNLFNINDADNILGSFIDQTTGALTANASQNTTHFIDVLPSQNISVSSGNTFGARFIWYDINKIFISGVSVAAVHVQAPGTARFLRVSVNHTLVPWATLQVEIGTNQTYFEAFKGLLDTSLSTPLIAKQIVESAALSAKNLALIPGKNLFNINSVDNFLGKFINNKQIDANASYNVTHAIEVEPSQAYTFSYKHNVAWYDVDRTFISMSASADTNKTQTSPANARYVRATVNLASWAAFQLEKGTAVTTWEAFAWHQKTLAGTAIYADRLDKTFALAATNLGYTTGKNLFNPNDPEVLLGQYIQYNNGLPAANASYNSTGYIEVTGSAQYTLSYKHMIAWYDSTKTYISGSNSSDLVTTQTAPSNAKYLRCTVLLASWPTFMVELGAVATAYEPFGWFIDSIGGTTVYPKNIPAKAESITAPVIAPKQYVARRKEHSLYYENLHRYFAQEGAGRTEITLAGPSATEITSRGKSLKFKQAVGNNSLASVAGSLKAYGKDFDLLHTIAFALQPSDETATTAKKVMDIGDSFTLRSAFVDAVNNGASATGLTFVGMRKSSQAAPQVNTEGRGGWTMANYHTVNTTLFSPFMQPQAPYKYYGNTSYWIAAVGFPADAAGHYDTYNVDAAILALYSGATGLLIAPAVNDVMYVNADSVYKRWDGAAWVTQGGLTFTFNFAKYRTLYSAPTVDIVHVLLGTNDFSLTNAAAFASSYSTYKQRMDAMITSFKADNASIKIVIGIPVSSGRLDEDGIYDTERRKMAYWLLAKNLIADYGNREGEGLVLADYHSTVDRYYGYDPAQVLPFDSYTGTFRDTTTYDYVHLSVDGFKQMANTYMGVIQSLR